MFELCQTDAKKRIQKIDAKRMMIQKIDVKIPIQKIAAGVYYNY